MSVARYRVHVKQRLVSILQASKDVQFVLPQSPTSVMECLALLPFCSNQVNLDTDFDYRDPKEENPFDSVLATDFGRRS